MYTIGEFASIGGVTVRMLRHYDRLGLLVPAHVNPTTGYRYYRAEQFRPLNRLIALKDLGFTLEQVGTLLADDVGLGELRGMLQLRRAELADQIDADRARLARVETRLQILEGDHSMSTDVTITELSPLRVAARSGPAASNAHEDVGPVVSQLLEELMGSIAGTEHGEVLGWYTPNDARGGLLCHAAVVLPAGAAVPEGADELELPAAAQAAVLQHCGPMESITASYQRLAAWIDDNGYRWDGSAREVYRVSWPLPQDEWVTELQMPISVA